MNHHIAPVKILTCLNHILARRDRPEHLDRRLVDRLSMLEHHHGIGMQRQHPAGRDLHRTAPVKRTFRSRSHEDLAVEGKICRHRLAGAEGIFRSDPEAVDR